MTFLKDRYDSPIQELIEKLMVKEPVVWQNTSRLSCNDYPMTAVFSQERICEASLRLQRFKPYFAKVFPETQMANGLIESELRKMNNLSDSINHGAMNLYFKLDSHLPISGSIKARGGIHEVLCHAEALVIQNGLLDLNRDYTQFDDEVIRSFLSGFTIQVGSTGNLGLSIGIISATLGFQVIVHMSSDAKAWKKDMLRSKGATVVEYADDYGAAVAAGRKASDLDPKSYFVDDERSEALFSGYAVAGERLEDQLNHLEVQVSEKKPLFVYLPCGVGGGPGGVAYGLKAIYGDLVHLFFVEPVASPCMLLSIATQTEDRYSVFDIGLDNQTQADGLAVGRASALVSRLMSPRLDGLVTVTDEALISALNEVWVSETLTLEPSALAGFVAFKDLCSLAAESSAFSKYAFNQSQWQEGTHIVWATGGSMVPQADFNQWIK